MPHTLKSVLKRMLLLMKEERVVGFTPNNSLTMIPASYFDAFMCDLDAVENTDAVEERAKEYRTLEQTYADGKSYERKRIIAIIESCKSNCDGAYDDAMDYALDKAIKKINE